MADNITAPAAGAVLATDDIGGVHYPRTKLSFGANGTATDVSTTDRLPVALPTGFATEAKQDDMIAAIENISPGGGGGGDASAAKQDQQTTLLAAIDTKLGAATYYPATQPVSGTVGISGGVAVTGTFWQATQPVSIAGTVAVSGPLTDTQLRATPVPVSGTFYQATQPVSAVTLPLPSGASTASNQSTIIGHVDGIETLLGTLGTQTTLAAILAKIIAAPATEAKQDTLLAAVNTIGTRTYGTALTRVAVASTSAQSAAITATEVMVHASTRCFIAVGSNPTATTNDIPLEAGEKFTLRLTSGHKVAVIRDTADGFLNIIPVV